MKLEDWIKYYNDMDLDDLIKTISALDNLPKIYYREISKLNNIKKIANDIYTFKTEMNYLKSTGGL